MVSKNGTRSTDARQAELVGKSSSVRRYLSRSHKAPWSHNRQNRSLDVTSIAQEGSHCHSSASREFQTHGSAATKHRIWNLTSGVSTDGCRRLADSYPPNFILLPTEVKPHSPHWSFSASGQQLILETDQQMVIYVGVHEAKH